MPIWLEDGVMGRVNIYWALSIASSMKGLLALFSDRMSVRLRGPRSTLQPIVNPRTCGEQSPQRSSRIGDLTTVE